MVTLGLVGYPLHHSLSPLLHQCFFEMTGVAGSYTAMPVAPEELITWFDRQTQARHLDGFNVTIPHKAFFAQVMSELSEEAWLTGAVNTVKWTGSAWMGFNTDVAGFISPIQHWAQAHLPDSSVLILGGGGASRAVMLAVLRYEPKQITMWVRDPQKHDDVREWVTALQTAVSPETQIDITAGIPLKPYALVVNTTPVGMWPNVEAMPASNPMFDALTADTLLYDLVYNPLRTQWLTAGHLRGLATQDGLAMLVGQGAEAFQLWTGQPLSTADREAAYQKLVSQLGLTDQTVAGDAGNPPTPSTVHPG